MAGPWRPGWFPQVTTTSIISTFSLYTSLHDFRKAEMLKVGKPWRGPVVPIRSSSGVEAAAREGKKKKKRWMPIGSQHLGGSGLPLLFWTYSSSWALALQIGKRQFCWRLRRRGSEEDNEAVEVVQGIRQPDNELGEFGPIPVVLVPGGESETWITMPVSLRSVFFLFSLPLTHLGPAPSQSYKYKTFLTLFLKSSKGTA